MDAGTPVGDPVEANAAGELFSRQDEVLIGSVKGNIGSVKNLRVSPLAVCLHNSIDI